jgi:hypothetical protein
MKYSEKELFAFMEQCEKGKQVRVLCTDGAEITGSCWAYSAAQNEEDYGVSEPSLDVGPGTLVYVGEIERVELL